MNTMPRLGECREGLSNTDSKCLRKCNLHRTDDRNAKQSAITEPGVGEKRHKEMGAERGGLKWRDCDFCISCSQDVLCVPKFTLQAGFCTHIHLSWVVCPP